MSQTIKPDKASRPARGEVWWVKLDPAKNYQTLKTRPCLVISADQINFGAADVAIGIPVEFQNNGIASHIRLEPDEVDIKKTGFIQCEDIRLIPLERFQRCAGILPANKMAAVEETVTFLLGL